MATFYKYAEREAENQIDWSSVSKDFTDMLKTEVETRDKKKADIEKATQETLKNLAEAPTGKNANMTKKILGFADDSKQYLLMMNRLLKSGQLNPKDYTIANQNLQRSTQQIFNISKEYQAGYERALDRNNKGDSNKVEVYMRSLAEKYANLMNSELIIDPETGQAMAAIPEKDPVTGQMVVPKDPSKRMSPEQLRFVSTVEIDKFKTQDSVNSIIDSMGQHVTAEMKGRIMRTISDITQRKGLTNPNVNAYMQAEKQFVEAALNGNPYNAQSILTNDQKVNPATNNPYEFTVDPNDPRLKKGHPQYGDVILMREDPNNPGSGNLIPELNEQQFEVAKDFMTRAVRIGLDRKEQEQYYEPPQPQEWQYRAREEKKKEADALNAWGQVFTATTPDDKRNAIQQILGTDRAMKRGLVDIDLETPGEITLIYSKESGIPPITRKFNPNTITFKDWAMLGTELHGVEDVATVVQRSGGFNPNQRMNQAQKQFKGVRASRNLPPDADELIAGYVSSVPKLGVTDADKAAQKLQSTYGKLGFKFDTENNLVYADRIKVISPDNPEDFIWVSLKGDYDQAIKDFIVAKKNDDLVIKNIQPPKKQNTEKGELDD